MKQKKLYISLPISGRNLKRQKALAKVFKNRWIARGWEESQVVTPFEIVTEDNPDWAEAMGVCVAELLRCSHMVLAEDWYRSRGCRVERAVAECVGVRILSEGEAL